MNFCQQKTSAMQANIKAKNILICLITTIKQRDNK